MLQATQSTTLRDLLFFVLRLALERVLLQVGRGLKNEASSKGDQRNLPQKCDGPRRIDSLQPTAMALSCCNALAEFTSEELMRHEATCSN